ncbi:MAG: hypothetical protein E6I76_05785, partial [Chloroflexi bacterium]
MGRRRPRPAAPAARGGDRGRRPARGGDGPARHPADVTAGAPVVLIAHGTRDEAGRDELRALTRAVAAGAAAPVRCGVIEYPAPGLDPVFATLAAAAEDARRAGHCEVRLVPLLLFPAGHAGDDLAVVIR